MSLRLVKNLLLIYTTLFCIFPLTSWADDAVNIAELKKEYVRPDTNAIPFPKENPYSKESELLGKMLFFDPRLSESNVTSCATCHNPSFSWSDAIPKAVGSHHQILARRTQTVQNLAWTELLFWDGRAHSLEEQALGPIASPEEMNMSLNKMTEKIKNIHGYLKYFKEAFPGDKEPINATNVAKAIATYERTIISGVTPFDKWIGGDENAISESAKNGFIVFNTKGNCQMCHSGWNFTDGSFHDIGHPDSDIGRIKILKLPSMQNAFKTPTLRNVENRSPYMHDGSLKTLEEVVDFYDEGGKVKRSSVDTALIKPLHLTAKEKKDLVLFMKTLTSNDPPVTFPILPTF